MQCGCHCISCGSTQLESNKVNEAEDDGYYDMHHTCLKCKTHFDHLDGTVFESCKKCNFKSS